MYRIECLIDGEWKPMIENGLVVYYALEMQANGDKERLQWECLQHGMDKEFRVVAHVF